MKIIFELNMGMVLYHKQTMKELTIDNTIKKEYDEYSQEYINLCKEYTEIVGFERETNKDKFDEELIRELIKQEEQIQCETIRRISNVIMGCYKNGDTAYINFAGYIINPNDFCVVRVKEFSYKFKKN